MEDTKTCTTCKQTKPLSDFSKDRWQPDKKRKECRPCAAERSRKWRIEHRATEHLDT